MRSYLEIAEFLRREGAKVDEDLCQLWRRIVFNMLISNTDDHLRNHGFLRGRKGWRLAPAYDLNPRADRREASRPCTRDRRVRSNGVARHRVSDRADVRYPRTDRP